MQRVSQVEVDCKWVANDVLDRGNGPCKGPVAREGRYSLLGTERRPMSLV